MPQPGARPLHEAAPETGDGEVLTGKPRGQYADGWHIAPVDAGDVTEVLHPGPVLLQDRHSGRVDLGVPGDGAAECLHDADVQSPVARAEAADQGGAGRRGARRQLREGSDVSAGWVWFVGGDR